ncbi:MAG: hypothetical protein AAF432_14305 [Planctomycetota bacterium]
MSAVRRPTRVRTHFLIYAVAGFLLSWAPIVVHMQFGNRPSLAKFVHYNEQNLPDIALENGTAREFQTENLVDDPGIHREIVESLCESRLPEDQVDSFSMFWTSALHDAYDLAAGSPQGAVLRESTTVFHLRRGWPMRQVAGTVQVSKRFDTDGTWVQQGWMTWGIQRASPRDRIQDLPEWSYDHWILTSPLWTGLILNSLLFGILFWPIWFTPRYLRRIRRRSRGRCVLCAYPVERGSICPECGTIADGRILRPA